MGKSPFYFDYISLHYFLQFTGNIFYCFIIFLDFFINFKYLLRINVGCRLVHYKDFVRTQNSSSQTYQLSLTDGKVAAAFWHFIIERWNYLFQFNLLDKINKGIKKWYDTIVFAKLNILLYIQMLKLISIIIIYRRIEIWSNFHVIISGYVYKSVKA